jgi:ferredoxin-NADP reductase
MKATIAQKKEIANGTLMVDFKLKQNISFKPGQFFFIKLPKLLYPDDGGDQRHFSIVNSPNEKSIIRMATRLTGSGFKKSLNELPIGTQVEIFNIMGEFILPKNKKKQIVFIAGGIGITPFMSMLRYVSEEKTGYNITLIYSNRNKESTAFFNDLVELMMKNTNIHVVFTMSEDSEWQGEKRMIDVGFIKDYFQKPNDNIYMVAGPPAMVTAVTAAIKTAGVNDNKIITENFAGY